MLSYVSGGLGIGLVPALALSDLAPNRVVVERADVPAMPVKLLSRPSARRSPLAVRFAAQIVEEGRRAGSRLRRLRFAD
jgi:DNA-binding transcriptional LysR family regulator